MYERSIKRVFDVVFAGLTLIALSPLMLLISLAIRIEDRGPAFFRQKRIGRNGAEFDLLKFRSMPVSASNVPKTDAGALTITRVGKLIRRTNLDELPQLINVLRGEMSLVGPRPAISSQTALIEMRKKAGVERCLPGMTGLAQVNAYDGMPETEKAAHDSRYASSISFANDFKILSKTFGYLLRRPPVY